MKENSRESISSKKQKNQTKGNQTDTYKQTDKLIQLSEHSCTYRPSSLPAIRHSDGEVAISAFWFTDENFAEKSSLNPIDGYTGHRDYVVDSL